MPVLNETDAYREFPVRGRLRQSVACLWVRRGDGGAVRILPDTCVDIVWRTGSGAVVAGPDTRAWLSHTRPGQTSVGVRFLPGAGSAALGVALAELRDQRVALSDLGLEWTRRLDDELDPARALELLATAAFRTGAPDAAVQAAVARLTDPAQRVERLADELGLSERQLRRRFLAAVGYGPKILQRVLRLRRFLASAGTEPSLAGAAFDAGYADQPHLVRECRTLTGLTPRELIAPCA